MIISQIPSEFSFINFDTSRTCPRSAEVAVHGFQDFRKFPQRFLFEKEEISSGKFF